MTIIADYAAGLPQSKIAEKLGLNERSIRRVIKDIKDAPIKADIVQSDSDIKTTVINECWTGFRAGINDPRDSYKRGTLSATGLKGLGVFQPDNLTQINNLYASMPEDWRAEYATSLDQGTKDSPPIVSNDPPTDE